MPCHAIENFVMDSGSGEFRQDLGPTTTDLESSGVDQAKELPENSATVVPAAPRNRDADTESQLDFESICIWILVPALLLLAILIRWYTNKGKNTKGLADPDSARGQFKKADRLLQSPRPSLANEFLRINFDIDDEIFAGEAAGSKSESNETFSTISDFSVAGDDKFSNESGELNVSEEDEEMMFGERKEAAFDQLVDQSDPPARENETAAAEANAPDAPAPVTGAESKPKQTVWPKKKFPPKKDAASTSPAAFVPNSAPVQQDRSTDQPENTTAASKTVASELTLTEHDWIEITDVVTRDEAESVARHEKVNAKLQQQSEEQKSQVFILEQQNNNFQAQSRQLELVIKKQATDFKELSEKLEIQANEAAELKQRLENETAQSVGYQEKLASLDVIQGELESARAKLATAQENLEASESRNSELRSRLDKAISDSGSIEKLTAANEELKQERGDACQRESDLMKQVASLQPLANEAETAKKEALALTQQIEDVQTEKDQLEQRLSEFESNAESLEESNREIIELRDQLKLADETKHQLRKRLDATLNAAERSKQLAQEHDQLKANLETFELEKAQLATKLDAECVRANALEERSAQLDDKIVQIELLEKQIDALKKELDDAQAQVGADNSKSETPNELISDKIKIKFTQLYRAYERERRLRKELEADLVQAEEQRDIVAHDLRELKKNRDS